MKIMKLITEKANDRSGKKIPTIAFLGDSVTQGCFEIYTENDGNIDTVFDKTAAYHSYLAEILNELVPEAPVNIINAGISGDRAPLGLKRLQRDVLAFSPDLTVVCYGLNDNSWGLNNIALYTDALDKIFKELKTSGSEVIFMTPNMQNTNISPKLSSDSFKDLALATAERENSGVLKEYIEAAKKVAIESGVKICDVYAKWRMMATYGINTTELLANKVNHPTRKMNWLFAWSLLDTMLEE